MVFDLGDHETGTCTVIISLMQKETKERIVKGIEEDIYMRFDIFKVSIYQIYNFVVARYFSR